MHGANEVQDRTWRSLRWLLISAFVAFSVLFVTREATLPTVFSAPPGGSGSSTPSHRIPSTASAASAADAVSKPTDGNSGVAAASSPAATPSRQAQKESPKPKPSPASGPASLPDHGSSTQSTPDGDLPEYLRDTAVVTLATGDRSGRLAVAWAQSLRDTNTRIPNIVALLSRGGVGSANCLDSVWKKARKREHVSCSGPDTIAEEIISEEYIAALTRLGVHVQVIDPIPDTPYTVIPGGRQSFWGMAFNKLRIFDPAFLPYRKLLWMDADTLVLKNVDHLLLEPMFTAAFTYACCNPNGPAQPSGGMWIVEPSREVADRMYALIEGPVPGTNDVWHWGDMQVVRYLFGKPPPPKTEQPYWPAIEDGRHGYIAGLENLPEVTQPVEQYVMRTKPEKRVGPGFINTTWDGKDPKYVWKSLSVLYDQCVGHCECLPGRDIPTKYYSIHYSCLQVTRKPSDYHSDHEFKEILYNGALSCTRYYFMLWLSYYEKAMGTTLPPPLWTGPDIPLYDAQHDDVVRAKRAASKNLL